MINQSIQEYFLDVNQVLDQNLQLLEIIHFGVKIKKLKDFIDINKLMIYEFYESLFFLIF